MSDPVYQGVGQPGYFFCDRDPTDTEPNVNAIPFPNNWLVGWFNQTTNNLFFCLDPTATTLVWERYVLGQLNMPRLYVPVASPAFSTPRSPSSGEDVTVSAIVTLTSTLLTPAEVDAQIDGGGGYVTIATQGMSGLAATNTVTLTFTVPAGSAYQLISSGTASLVGVWELTN
jgi:hypothetical protein